MQNGVYLEMHSQFQLQEGSVVKVRADSNRRYCCACLALIVLSMKYKYGL